ncbi:MAG: hypothetical protein GY803_18415, partial [Chloroflexi bacterium]|nr:hypothetical protein [Chloroflexota bacterium]
MKPPGSLVAFIMEAIQQAIEKANRILAVTHIGPDGDALGSLTAVGTALTQWGKQFSLVCDNGAPRRFDYLPLS